jgi:hypothetical protein
MTGTDISDFRLAATLRRGRPGLSLPAFTNWTDPGETMKYRAARLMVLGFLGASLACGGGDAGEGEEAADTGAAGTPPAGGAAPPAAGGGTTSAALITDMRGHLSRLEAAGGDEIPPMVPEHASRVEALIAQMERERQARGAMVSAAWDATVDSVRQDLTRMRGLTASDLEGMVDAHAERVTRLMDLHTAP